MNFRHPGRVRPAPENFLDSRQIADVQAGRRSFLRGAFAAALGSYYGQSAWLGVLAGVAGGALLAIVYGVSAIRFRADQVVVGIAINLLAIGVTRFFLRLAFGSSSNSPRVPGFGGEQSGPGHDRVDPFARRGRTSRR